jgi:MFS family permease
MAAVPGSARQMLAHRPFQHYFLGRGFANFGRQIIAVAIGWQVYEMTQSALALGLVGLVQFLPTALLTFHAGHAADRFERRRLVQVSQIVQAAGAAWLAWGSLGGWISVTQIFVVAALMGAATAFERPAAAAMLPGVVPEGLLQRGTALTSSVMEVASISGPALGGLAYAVSPGLPYLVTTAFFIAASVHNGLLWLKHVPRSTAAPDWASLFAGVRFVRSNPTLLGAISLDLFAVLLGGATALLPIYASDILHTGPWGLGLLRAAPAVGSLLMTAVLARWPISREVGLRMFQGVIVFGLATILFALSRDLWLSMGALLVMGAADTVSVVIRLSLVQLATPDEMRGRVSAVNFLFVNASNQLGEFESGVTAALLGVVPAAVVGGIGTVAVALLWMRWFPGLRRLQKLE